MGNQNNEGEKAIKVLEPYYIYSRLNDVVPTGGAYFGMDAGW